MDQNLLEYFIAETKEKLAEIKVEQKEMNQKIDQILKFKWQIISVTGIISLIVTFLLQVLSIFYNKGD